MLHVIGGRQVHQVGSLLLEDRHASSHHEFGKIRRVDFRQRLADAREHVTNPVLCDGYLVGLLGGERDGASACHVEALAEHRT